MRFSTVYQNGSKPVISFEVFPPKDEKAEKALRSTIANLVKLKPDFMTVTYGAMGTTQGKTLETAIHIREQFGLDAACHLTCIGASREDLTRTVLDIHRSGVRNIVALRGDFPKGQEEEYTPPPDACHYANELVEHIRAIEKEHDLEPFGLAVAGYPEKHLEADTFDTDLNNLRRKVAAGGDCIITQLFFDNSDFYSYLDKVKKVGIDVPVVPGLMPIVSAKQILKISSMCGSCIPDDLMKKLEKVQDDMEATQAIGVEHCIKQATDLLEQGVPGIHFYVLNRSKHMREIMRALRKPLGRPQR